LWLVGGYLLYLEILGDFLDPAANPWIIKCGERQRGERVERHGGRFLGLAKHHCLFILNQWISRLV
jgi:hypothetical protein